MNGEQAGLLVGTIRAAYPRDWSEETRAIYIKMLSDLDYNVTSKMLEEWIKTHKWLPTIADIRMGVSEQLLSLPTEQEAVASLQRWLSKQLEFAELHPLVKSAITYVGDTWTWKTSDRHAQMMRDFHTAYVKIRNDEIAEASARRNYGENIAASDMKELG